MFIAKLQQLLIYRYSFLPLSLRTIAFVLIYFLNNNIWNLNRSFICLLLFDAEQHFINKMLLGSEIYQVQMRYSWPCNRYNIPTASLEYFATNRLHLFLGMVQLDFLWSSFSLVRFRTFDRIFRKLDNRCVCIKVKFLTRSNFLV